MYKKSLTLGHVNLFFTACEKSGLKKQGIDDALIQPYSGHSSRQSLEIYSRLSIGEAQEVYEQVMGKFPV